MYFILWIIDFVFLTVGLSLIGASVMSLLVFFIYLAKGKFSLDYIGYSLVLLGVSVFLFIGVYYFTKLCAFVTKHSMLGIKSWFIRGGKNEKRD